MRSAVRGHVNAQEAVHIGWSIQFFDMKLFTLLKIQTNQTNLGWHILYI